MSPPIGILDPFLPSLCTACGRGRAADSLLCAGCRRGLDAAEPLRGLGSPGLDRAWSSAAHEGAARALVAALKFRRLLPVAALMAERIDHLAPAWALGGAIVPVPTAPLRTLARGFDPAAELATALAARRGTGPPVRCLGRRLTLAGRQVGRRRAERLGDPPAIRARGSIPRGVVLVDDVMTTGATLSACARALRAAGAVRVVAVTFTRRL